MDFKERLRKEVEERYPRVKTLYCEHCGRPTEHKRVNDIFAMTRPIIEVMECQQCGNEKTIEYDITLRI